MSPPTKGSLWNALASLRLTVACLAIAIVVIFIGTIAQADEGLYEAQARYFKQWLVWGPMLFGHRLPILLPGGYLLGTVLVVNLIAAHSKRFTWSVRKIGIHLAHLGIVVLLVGQLISDMVSTETHLRLREEESRSYTEQSRAHELVLIRNPGNDDEETFSFPESEIADGREELVTEDVPFALRVEEYQVNSDIFSREAVLQADKDIRAARATVEARFATAEDLEDQAENDRQNRRRAEIWRASLAAIGEDRDDDIAATVHSMGPDRRERLRRELIDRFQQEMLAAFVHQGGAARVAAERLARDEEVRLEALPRKADRGAGRNAFAIALPKTKELNAVNFPYASVEFSRNGNRLGSWLLSPWLGLQTIVDDNVVWQAALRPVRVNHPFEITLLRTTHEVYPGTEIPKNFQSRIRIDHPGRNETREVDISMNDPLRYEGLTFFQYQMGEDEFATGQGTSILLVVRNPGWFAPYLGCLLVAFGLSWHFALHLASFLRKRQNRADGAAENPASGESNGNGRFDRPGRGRSLGKRCLAPLQRCSPVLVAGFLITGLFVGLRGPDHDRTDFALDEFGKLPVVANGRIQPMDSLARNALLQLRERASLNLEPWKSRRENPEVVSATEWMLTMMTNADLASDWPVFRIDHPELKSLLDLPPAGIGESTDGKHYSWLPILDKLQTLQREARRAGEIEQEHRTSYERALVKLWGGVALYMRLQNTLQPQNADDWERELSSFAAHAPAGISAMLAREAGRPHDPAVLARTERDLQRFDVMAQLDLPLIIPPAERDGQSPDEGWMNTVDGLVHVARHESIPAGLAAYARIASAYRSEDAGKFNQAVADYRRLLEDDYQPVLAKVSREYYFNWLAPFYKALIIYGLGFVCALGFWCAPRRLDWLRRLAVALVGIAFVVHTAGLLFRMGIEGRPPVTNLYSSAIFVGWGASFLGLILERVSRNSIGVAVSSVIGFLTMIVAHHLSLGGDTMEMVSAVLDTNFWLATHVVVITLGYSAMFVAGTLAALHVMLGNFPRLRDSFSSHSFGRMVYGIICFATLFSFVGTLLGGIWADQSWGRFWGWDPKENGALIIVLWNALILHARWGGFVRERGLMNLAILGNIVTAWSWFGVNMLGIGLHSYGFIDESFRWLLLFVASQLAIAAFGLRRPPKVLSK